MRGWFIAVLAAAAVAGGCQSEAPSSAQGGGGAGTRPAAVDEGSPIGAAEATLVVHGLSCPLCANNVDQQLLKVPGVRSVKVNMGDGTVRVGFKDLQHPTRAQLAQAVARSGYTLKSIETP